MTAFCRPQGQYISLHLDTKQAFHPFQTSTKPTTKKGFTSSIITGSLTVMRMAQRDTNQSKTKINNREFKQLQPWRRQCKKNWFLWPKQQLCTCTMIFSTSLMSTIWLRRETFDAIFHGGREDTRMHFPTSLFEARWSPYEFNSMRNHPNLINWVSPNRRDKVWKSAN